MVLSGCRISSSLTNNDKLQTQGGTYRRKQGTEQSKRTKGKPNRPGSRCAPEELSSGAQDRQWGGGSSAELREQRSVVALRAEAARAGQGSGGALRGRATGLEAVSGVKGRGD